MSECTTLAGMYDGLHRSVLRVWNSRRLSAALGLSCGFENSRAAARCQVRTYKCFEFDGNVPHMTMPFYGSRYSLVFFERRSSAEASQRQKDELLRLGFPLADWPMWNQIRWHSLAWGSYGARMGPYN